jgi:hypothetical protein
MRTAFSHSVAASMISFNSYAQLGIKDDEKKQGKKERSKSQEKIKKRMYIESNMI